MQATGGFILGSIVGFLGSFISKIKEIFIIFGGFFIEKAYIEVDTITFINLIKRGKLVLLNKDNINKYYYINLNKQKGNEFCEVREPFIHNYRGLVYLKNNEKNRLKKIKHIFYLEYNDIYTSPTITIYSIKNSKIIKKLSTHIFNNIIKENKNKKSYELYDPEYFEIEYVKDKFSASSITSRQKLDPSDSHLSESKNEDVYPRYIFWTAYKKLYYSVPLFLGKNIENDKPIKTFNDILKKYYPYFYPSQQFKQLFHELKVWERVSSSFSKKTAPILTKRCILLYGPPGTGKSFMTLVATHVFDKRLFVFDLLNITQETFIETFEEYSQRIDTVLLFEDIDVYFEYHRNNLKQDLSLYNKNITKPSVFFNMIDGINKNIKCMIIYTTNFPDKLDDRMVKYDNKNNKIILNRPGRVDKAIHVGYAEKQCVAYIVKGMINEVNRVDWLKNNKLYIPDNYIDDIIKFIENKFDKKNGQITTSEITNLCYQKILDYIENNIGTFNC